MFSKIAIAPCFALLPMILLAERTPAIDGHSIEMGSDCTATELVGTPAMAFVSAQISCPGFEDVTRTWTITVVFAGNNYVTCSEKDSTLKSMMREHIEGSFYCSSVSECPAQDGQTPICNPMSSNFTLANSECAVVDLSEMDIDALLEAVGAADDFERGSPQPNGFYKVTTIEFEMTATGTLNCNCPNEF